MNRRINRASKRLTKRSKKGFRGYPVGIVAFYGPDDLRASKVVASIIERDGADISELRKWYDSDVDVRDNPEIVEGITGYLEQHGARSVTMTDRIIGCPHEEGIDYEGTICPECPFWADRDRWTGELIR